MTDEEKAEKYAKEISRCRECINYNYCHKIENEYHPKCKKWEWLFVGLKKGLAEGRKEVREHETTCINGLHHIEKENTELKEKLRQFEEGETVCIKHYEAIRNYPILKEQIEDWKADHKHNLELMQGLNERIAELKKDKEYLNKVNDEQTGVILKLNEQIEKMKPRCKPLCKNYSKFIVMESDCIHGTCKNCDKWEMYE